MIGVLFTGLYILKAIRAVLHGPKNPKWAGHGMEMNVREIATVVPLMDLDAFARRVAHLASVIQRACSKVVTLITDNCSESVIASALRGAESNLGHAMRLLRRTERSSQ